MHDPNDLIYLFSECFETKYRTKLIQGGEEPLYKPAENPTEFHLIYFAHGFFSSALHEIAHWLIAGSERRLQLDYGYWYKPDGRNAKEQQLFQSVEVKPQALEWHLSNACGYRFQYSFDNLNGDLAGEDVFKNAVQRQLYCYETKGLHPRAKIFYDALKHFYGSRRI